MLKYDPRLKQYSRQLRMSMTDSEKKLWSALRGKQILGVQFYRQKPIGSYIVDFYSSAAKTVIEIDGSQHEDKEEKIKDLERDDYLYDHGLKVLRYNNIQVLQEFDGVIEIIFNEVQDRI